MALETLRLIRNILLRSFAVGIGFALVMLIAMLTLWSVWTGLAVTWFHSDEAHLSGIALGFFTSLRFFLVFVLLAPGLAVHWTYKSELARRATT